MAIPIITPAGPLVMRGLQTQSLTANQAVTWSSPAAGVLSSITSTSVIFTCPNITGSYTVRATNGSAEFAEVTITATGVFIWVPSWTSDGKAVRRVFMARADSGAKQFRKKSPKKRFYKLTFTERTLAEYNAVDAFFNAHYPNLTFYWTDPSFLQEKLFYCDSLLQGKPDSFNDFDYSIQFREK